MALGALTVDGKDINVLIDYAHDLKLGHLVIKVDPSLGGVLVVEEDTQAKLIVPISSKRCKASKQWIGAIPIEFLNNIDNEDTVEIIIEKPIDQTRWMVTVNFGMQSEKAIAYGSLVENVSEPGPLTKFKRGVTIH